MATLFLDFEQGNDNYGGTSFNLLASGTDGRITSTTFSAATASFPNDGSLINQYLSIFNGTIYAIYQITAWVSSTSLTIAAISGGTALANQTIDRQYYIGGRWQTLSSGVTAVRIIPGDTIRIKASPDPTSLGVNGTWTSSPLQPTRVITSSTNATPIVITCNSHGYSNGDTVVITGHTTNTNANGTWEISNVTTNTFTLVNSIGNGVGSGGTARLRNNTVVRLASALTANIASCGNRGSNPARIAWTTADAVNVTVTQNTTDYKEGDVSDSVAVGVNFTTGRAAYYATGTLNLSGYQQVSFWIKQTAGTVTVAGDVSLRLCSDTAGVTTVHTVSIPALGALNIWQPITVDLATNLSSSIQSIALYIDTDRGAVTFLLSNIIACKASSSNDSLSLISLIGKNTGTEPWIAIQSINGTRIFLDGLVSYLPTTTSLMGYNGTSETVLTYKRETIPIFSSFVPPEGGTVSSIFNVIGGYDRTNMSTLTSNTYLDGRRNNLIFLDLTGNNKSYWSFSNISMYRFSTCMLNYYNTAINILNSANLNHNNIVCQPQSSTAPSNTVSGIYNVSFNNTPFYLNTDVSNFYLTNINNMDSNSSSVVSTNGTAINLIVNSITNINNNGNTPISIASFFGQISNIGTINNNFTRGINLASCSDFIVNNINSISGSTSTITAGTYTNCIGLSSCDNCQLINISGVIGATASAITCTNSFNNQFINVNTSGSTTSAFAGDIGTSYCRNCTFNESTLVTGLTANRGGTVFLQNQNNNSNNHLIYSAGGLISSETSIRNTSSGVSWKLSPTSASRNIFYPVSLSLSKILIFSNKLVTIRAMMYRTNSELTLRLRIAGNQIAGVPNDITSAVTNVGSWQKVSLTFIPTETGVIELLGEAFGGTTFSGYIDDLTITQVS